MCTSCYLTCWPWEHILQKCPDRQRLVQCLDDGQMSQSQLQCAMKQCSIGCRAHRHAFFKFSLCCLCGAANIVVCAKASGVAEVDGMVIAEQCLSRLQVQAMHAEPAQGCVIGFT